VTLNFTGMKEYGVSFAASMAEDVAPPVEGARYSMLLGGTATGQEGGAIKGEI
jgi:hypothetical protein